jgi:diguanylate cyclase (GGDEF)-like protein/PAS domain S-box-containing protein
VEDEPERRVTSVARGRDWYQSLIDRYSPDVALVLDPTGTVRYASRSIERVAGFRAEDLVGRSGLDLLHPDDLDYAVGSLIEARDFPGDHSAIELRFRTASGAWLPCELETYNPPELPDHMIVGLRGVARRTLLPERRRALERWVLGLGEICAGATVDSLDRDIDEVLSRLGDVCEAHEARLASLSPVGNEVAQWQWVRPDTRPALHGLRTAAAVESAFGQVVDPARLTAMGGPVVASEVTQPVRARSDESVAGLLTVAWHVADARRYWDEANAPLLEAAARTLVMSVRRIQHEQALAYQALHDPLTGLANRARLLSALEHELRRVSGRELTRLAVAFLDLDGFKAVNDTHGHSAGDELLRLVGGRLRDSVRVGDLVCRVGGDEFVVLSPGIESEEEADHLATRIRRRIADPVPLSSGEEVTVSSSIGVVVVTGSGAELPSADGVLRVADRAMYVAKGEPEVGVRVVGIDSTEPPVLRVAS